MDSCPPQNIARADDCPPLSPTSLPSSTSVSSPMAPPSASTPITGQPPPQLGQCVYVLSPWTRNRTVFPANQPPPTNSVFRFPTPSPGPVGLMRIAPYRPYYPARTLDNRYTHEFYNNPYQGGPADFSYSAEQNHQTEEPNYESMYHPGYPPQAPMYSPYNQQRWTRTVAYSAADSDKNRTLAFYPERVPKLGTSSEYVAGDNSNGCATSGNVTKKSVRVKFMGPEAMYLTTKTLEMQPERSSLEVTGSPGLNVDTPPGGNFQVYETLGADSTGREGGLDLNEVVVQTSNDGDGTREHEDDQERVTFGSIEEALASIDPTSLAEETAPQPGPALEDKTFLQVSAVAYQGLRMADEKQEEVIKAAKSLFSKRTRTLYHWLYPQTSKNKLKATVSAAWDTLAEMEKQFYVSQVLGRFGLQASSLMINPQLDGIKGLPSELLCSTATSAERPRLIPPSQHSEPGKMASAIEAQQAVDQLFASCADSESWTSYCGAVPSNMTSCANLQSPILAATSLVSPAAAPAPALHYPRSAKARAGFCGGSQGQTDSRRKRSFSRMAETGGRARLGSVNDQLDEEVTILKRMREAKVEADFEEDSGLTNELDKYRLMTHDSDRNFNCSDGDDFWRRTPDPEDLFTHLEF